MKICVLGLDGATPEKIFQDERLVHIRRLMDLGVYGKLKAVAQTATVPVWMSMGSSQNEALDPNALAIWTLLADNENRSALIGLTSDFPPYEVNGVSFASFPAPQSTAEIADAAPELTTEPIPHSLAEQVSVASHTRWQTARSLFSQRRWAYFQVVDLGLQTFAVDSTDSQAISDYCLWLDEQVGSMLELLDDETLLLIVSPRGLGRSSPSIEGMFILIAPNCPLNGEYQGATLLDMAPTMLDLVGHEIPSTMQGRSLVAQMQKKDSEAGTGVDEEALLRDRLAGLGYI
jgi:predicted AlkP superfamily phosphohydrolase/phosphomutase